MAVTSVANLSSKPHYHCSETNYHLPQESLQGIVRVTNNLYNESD